MKEKQAHLSLTEKLKAKEVLAQQLIEKLKAKEVAQEEKEPTAPPKKELSLTDNIIQKHDFKNIIGCGG